MLNLIAKIKSLIKFASIISSSNSSGYISVSALDIQHNKVMNFIPYGLQSNAPATADIVSLLLAVAADEENLVAMNQDINNRDKNLDTGEVAIGVPSLKTRIRFTKDKKIIVNIDGTDGGDYIAKFNELKAGFDQLKNDVNSLISAYNLHVHAITTAPGTSAPTLSTANLSSASIDSSKLAAFEVPNL